MATSQSKPWPEEIRHIRAERRLEVAFDDGKRFSLPAEYLRVESPSAEVQGHHPGERKTVPGKSLVAISGIDQVGRYAIRINFDDGHNTGIFSWTKLYELGRDYETIWQGYLNKLAAANLSRDPT